MINYDIEEAADSQSSSSEEDSDNQVNCSSSIRKNNERILNDCCLFLDKYLSATRPVDDIVLSHAFDSVGEDSDLHAMYDKSSNISHQLHIHRINCKQMEKIKSSDNLRVKPYRYCKYGFPKPIMEKTTILRPLEKDHVDLDVIIARYKLIRDCLTQIVKDGENSKIKTLDELLGKLKINFDEYIDAIRSSIKVTTPFLQRSYRDLMVNNYCPELYVRWRANMDAQFVTDPYGAAAYLVKYALKSREIDNFIIDQAIRDVENGNMDMKKMLHVVANRFLNGKSFSAQECSMELLSTRLSKTSRDVFFINTFPKSDRYMMLKHREILEIQQESVSVYARSLQDYYSARPETMKNMSLFEFATQWRVMSTTEKKKGYKPTRVEDIYEDDNEANEEDAEENLQDDQDTVQLIGKDLKGKNITIGYAKRLKGHSKIARVRGYKLSKEPELYYYEQILLFFPWKNEDLEVATITDFAAFHHANRKVIAKNKALFEKESTSNFEEEAERLEREMIAEWESINQRQIADYNNANRIMQKKAEVDKRRRETGDRFGHEIDDILDEYEENTEDEILEDMLGFQADPFADENTRPVYTVARIEETIAHDFLAEMDTDETKYSALIVPLNRQQHKYLVNMSRSITSNQLPFHDVIIGGSGTGKSFLIKALTATAKRLFNAMDKYVRADAPDNTSNK